MAIIDYYPKDISGLSKASQASSASMNSSVESTELSQFSCHNEIKLKNLIKHFGAILGMSATIQPSPITPGLRVVRGPDWKWDNQDGGEGMLGTVQEVTHREGHAKAITVQWDSGVTANYRSGIEDAFDLRIWDSGPIGVRHMGHKCHECQTKNFFGLRWRCSLCENIDLCTTCYMTDKHDVCHTFRRFDSPQSRGIVIVPARARSRKVGLRGTLVGAEVVRSTDWEWPDAPDGGGTSTGTVTAILGWKDKTARSIVRVTWAATGQSFECRLGHIGKVDVRCTDNGAALGNAVYLEHLPDLGKPEVVLLSKEQSLNRYKVGDAVRVWVDAATLHDLQAGHGDYHPHMADFVFREGVVHRITSEGDVRVQFPGSPPEDFRWTFNPDALQKISAFRIGDSVMVSSDEHLIRQLQVDHGEWVDQLKLALGKQGVVDQIDANGNLVVKMKANGRLFTLNPRCVTKSGKSTSTCQKEAEIIDACSYENFLEDSAKGDVHRIEELLLSANCNPPPLSLVRRALQLATRKGHLAVVRVLCGQYPECADAPEEGKRPLHTAVQYGHLDIADWLLTDESVDIDASDPNDGETPIHFAVRGRQPTAVRFLIERGATVDVKTQSGLTGLHYAVFSGEVESVKALLEAGASYTLTNNYRNSALHMAASCEKATVEILEVLLSYCREKDLERYNKGGFNVLHYAAMKGRECCMPALLKKHPGLAESKMADGSRAIHVAAVNGKFGAVKFLIREASSTVDTRDMYGRTPLQMAVVVGYIGIVKLLIYEGRARINTPDTNGDTALLLAVARKGDLHHQMAEPAALEIPRNVAEILIEAQVPEHLRRWIGMGKILIDHGADTKYRNFRGCNCLDHVSDPAARRVLMNAAFSRKGMATSRRSPESREPGLGSKAAVAAAVPERVECRICSERVEPVIFRPCNHAIVCRECSQRMKKCLQCSKEIAAKEAIVKPKSSEPKLNSGEADSASSSDEKIRDLQAKVHTYEEQLICSICMERPRNVAFMCGHQVCGECAQTLQQCHMCREPVTNRLNLYP